MIGTVLKDGWKVDLAEIFIPAWSHLWTETELGEHMYRFFSVWDAISDLSGPLSGKVFYIIGRDPDQT